MSLMLMNVATRKVGRAVRLPEAGVPSEAGSGLSKSAVSRRFKALTQARLDEWMASDLSGLDLLLIQIDGLHMDDTLLMLSAVGIDADGRKHPLGVVEGATENAANLLDRLRLAQIPRQDAGRESDLVGARLAIPHTRHLHGNRADTGQDFALWKVAMTDQPRPSVLELMVCERGQQRDQLRLDRLLDQLACPASDDVGQRVRQNPGWIRQLGDGIVRHVAYPFLG